MALPTKTLGPLTFKLDRPKGYKKVWPPSPAYPEGRTWVYPVDYGFLPGIKGEDGEGLDAFVGDDPDGVKGSFLKLKPGEGGALVPDETKFVLGVTDAELRKVLAFYGREASGWRTYAGWGQVLSAVERFKPKKKDRYRARPEAEAKLAALLAVAGRYALKLATLQALDGGQVIFNDTGDAASPAHQHAAEQADLAKKLQAAMSAFDARTDTFGHEESSNGSLFQGDVIG